MNLRNALIVCLLLVPTIACGQQPAPVAPSLAPSNELKLSLTLQEAELIWVALRKLPVEQVEQVMAKIRQQVSEQTQQPKPDPNKPVDNKEKK